MSGLEAPFLPQPWSGSPKINSHKYSGAPLLGMCSIERIVRQSPNYDKLTQLVCRPAGAANSAVKEVICRSGLLLIVTETETTHCSAACLRLQCLWVCWFLWIIAAHGDPITSLRVYSVHSDRGTQSRCLKPSDPNNSLSAYMGYGEPSTQSTRLQCLQ